MANYVLLERIELNDTTASIVFNNIPPTGYTDLKLVVSARSTTTGGNAWEDINININNVGWGTSISTKLIYGTGAATGSNSVITGAGGLGSSGATTANTFGNAELYFPNYTSATNKSFSNDSVQENNATSALSVLLSGLWSNTSAINSIALRPNAGSFVANSSFSLYGIAKSGTTPAIAPKADGGNIIATDGTYWYHAFLSNGTFTPQVGLTADVLVVAGGGGGGSAYVGAGGGAGGLRLLTSQSLSTTSYTCTVGAGGAGGLAVSGGTAASGGTNGINSSFSAISTSGGGGGGANTVNGKNGGSGGGASYTDNTPGTGNAGSYSPVEGYAGGSAPSGAPFYGSGGGGGAGGAGVNGSSTSGGTGGAGANSYNGTTFTSWLTATSLGVSGYLAGGGGGSGYTSSPGSGGSGGGGNGSVGGAVTTAMNGVANTGSGGGGNERTPTQGAAGAGGSGIIIIRYAV